MILWMLALLIPWLSALVIVLLPSSLDRWAKGAGLIGTVLGACAATLSLMVDPVPLSSQVVFSLPWAQGLGLDFVVMRDGLSIMFVIIASWIACIVTLFAWQYLPQANRHEDSARSERFFYSVMAFFTGAMTGVIVSGNLIQFYLFWELTGIASYLLIGYWDNLGEARKGSLLALGLTVPGGVAMLLGFLLIGINTGEWTFPAILQLSGDHPGSNWLTLAAVLIVIGALAKSAQFPFMAWLPAAMAAPTPVSALLHSCSLVALGVYLLARLFPLVGSSAAWEWSLLAAATIGVIYSGFLAVRQDVMKGLLAYSTISQYAFIFLGFSLGTWFGVRAALYAFSIHAFIKAGLFLVAGAVTHLTGHKEFDKTGRIAGVNPILTAFAAVLGLSLAGVPILAGFFYKEEILKAAFDIDAWFIYAVVLIGSILSFAYTARFFYDIFLAPPPPQHSVSLPVSMGLPIGITAVIALLTSLIPDWMGSLLEDAVSASTGVVQPFEVQIEISAVFWTSVAGVAAGFLLWLLWQYSGRARASSYLIPSAISRPIRAAGKLYNTVSLTFVKLHTGDLRFYLRLVLTAFLVVTAVVWSFCEWPCPTRADPFDILNCAVLAASVLAAGSTIFVRHHLTFLLILTLFGYCLSAAFLLIGAPNVALAQVLVETLIVLSLILALRDSLLVDPNRTTFIREKKFDAGRWAISCSAGAVMGFLTYIAADSYPSDAVGRWYAGEGYAETGVHNFVSMVLTDFRGLDTLVEIIVFAVSILGVSALYAHRERRYE